MRVFLTGGTGLIGSAIIPELINEGHRVLALARSAAGAQALAEAGAEVHQGSLEDLASLRDGASQSDSVIHCAFDHDFSRFQENAETEKRAIEALGSALRGSDRRLIVSTGLALFSSSPTRPITEDHEEPDNSPAPRMPEQVARVLSSRGVSVTVVRLPNVHNIIKQGLVSQLLTVAREKGVSAYVAEGLHRWPAAHVLDVARLYRLILEKRDAGPLYHAVSEEGISLRQIAEAIGRGLKVPVISLSQEASAAHFGFVGRFAGVDLSTSSAITRERLGWIPSGPGLIEDLNNARY